MTGGLRLPVLLLIPALCGCGARGETRVERLVQRVITVQAAECAVIPEIKSFGSISFRKKTDISSAAGGVLKRIPVEEGEIVVQGQPLAIIDNPQLEIGRHQAESAVNAAAAAVSLSEAKLREGRFQVEARLISIAVTEAELEQKAAELADIEARLHGKEKVYAVGGVSEEAMASLRTSHLAARTSWLTLSKELEIKRIGLRNEDIASAGLPHPRSEEERRSLLIELNTRTLAAELMVTRAQLDAALSELEAAERLLGELVVRSPESGIVAAVFLAEGERVGAGVRILTVFDTSRIYAVFPVTEGDALLISEGMPVEITADSIGEMVFGGTVHLVSPTVDPLSGSTTVKALFDNSEGRFRPGMFIRARVILGEARGAVLLPETAIARKSGGQVEIFTVVNGRAFRKDVLVSPAGDGRMEIIQGLSAGEIVIDCPSPLLREGEEVDCET